MTTKRYEIEVNGIAVEIVRKDIRNLHLGVYPPEGRVRVAAPLRYDEEAIRLAVVSRLRWVHQQRESFLRQERQSQREMVSGESHYYKGRRYRLNIIEQDAPPQVRVCNGWRLDLFVRPGSDRDAREKILNSWYRKQLRIHVSNLVGKWESKIGVTVANWGIKKMKTRWGSCNHDAKRIWVNLELAKKPTGCVEYIVVHEMIHLLEPHHNDQFRDHLNRLLPKWRLYRDELNSAPLPHDDWHY